jgi:hypothetical protein
MVNQKLSKDLSLQRSCDRHQILLLKKRRKSREENVLRITSWLKRVVSLCTEISPYPAFFPAEFALF